MKTKLLASLLVGSAILGSYALCQNERTVQPWPNPYEQPYATELFTGSETHAVLVMNDDVNTMQYVADTFTRILDIPYEQSVNIMLRIHHEGTAIVWTGSAAEVGSVVQQLDNAGLGTIAVEISDIDYLAETID